MSTGVGISLYALTWVGKFFEKDPKPTMLGNYVKLRPPAFVGVFSKMHLKQEEEKENKDSLYLLTD